MEPESIVSAAVAQSTRPLIKQEYRNLNFNVLSKTTIWDLQNFIRKSNGQCDIIRHHDIQKKMNEEIISFLQFSLSSFSSSSPKLTGQLKIKKQSKSSNIYESPEVRNTNINRHQRQYFQTNAQNF